MMFQTFKARFIIPVTIAVIALVAVGSILLSQYLTGRERDSVSATINHEIASLTEVMNVTAALMDDRALSGLEILRGRILSAGTISKGTVTDVGGVAVSDILVQGRSQASSYSFVDDLTTSIGGSATIYSKKDSDFIRVSTNVKKQNGLRGIGTSLDHATKAYQALIQGKPYYGITDILGKKYFAAYEPLSDESGNVIGALYFGYLADFSVVQSAVDKAKILESGYLAVIDSGGVIRYRKSSVTSSDTDKLVKGAIDGWEITRLAIPAWNYTVVAGYPLDELNEPVEKVTRILLLSGAVLAVIISAVIYFLLDKNVITLLGGEPKQAAEYMRQMATGDLAQEILVKDKDDASMMASMRVMQMKLKNITRSIQGPMTEVLDSTARLSRSVGALTEASDPLAAAEEIKSDADSVVKSANILQKAINRLRM
jgi:methyl-accepting chemotaxis protein